MKLSSIAAFTVVSILAVGAVHANERGPATSQSGQGTDIERTDTHENRDMRGATGHYDGEPIEVEDFVETATAKGIAELETSKLALEKGSPRIQEFANRMITDHTESNRELADLATTENIAIPDKATLMDKAKTLILQVRDGESFDEAYVNNQIAAHEKSIALFNRGAKVDNTEISQFAEKTLPKLEEHLRMATDLKDETAAIENR